MYIIVAPDRVAAQPIRVRASIMTLRKWLLVRGRGDTKKNQHGSIEPHDVGIRKTSNIFPKFRLRNSRNLVNHQSTSSTQSIFVIRFDGEAEQWRFRWIGSERADRNGFCLIESIILNDYRWTRFAGIVFASRHSPNLAALHLSSQSEIESTKS